MTKISKSYNIKAKGSIDLPTEGLLFITAIEIKAKAKIEVGKSITFPTFGVSDNAGVINAVGCTKFDMRGVSFGGMTVENPNDEAITIYVTAEQSHD